MLLQFWRVVYCVFCMHFSTYLLCNAFLLCFCNNKQNYTTDKIGKCALTEAGETFYIIRVS